MLIMQHGYLLRGELEFMHWLRSWDIRSSDGSDDLHELRDGDVLGCSRGLGVYRLCGRHLWRQYRVHFVHSMQRGCLFRGKLERLHQLRCRDLHGCDRGDKLHGLCCCDILDGGWGLGVVNMYGLCGGYLLDSGRSFSVCGLRGGYLHCKYGAGIVHSMQHGHILRGELKRLH